MTPEQYRVVQALYRTNLSSFIRKSFEIVNPAQPFIPSWHLDCISEYLHACHRREIKRLIINIPPRSLKSISCSIGFPAWLLGQNPSEKIISVSYAHELASKLSNDCRAVMQTKWYEDLFPETRLDKVTEKMITTTARGFRYATSTGGTLTGQGANFILIDDPLNALMAASTLEREKANTWYQQTLSSRLDDRKTGVIIVIMQRLHQTDMAGFLLEQGGFEHLKIPLIEEELEKKYSIGSFSYIRTEGEYLSKMWDDETIAIQKRESGAYVFAGQYQQTPSPTGGGEFRKDWIKFYRGKLQPNSMNTYIMIDPANSKRKESDYTAMVVVGLGSDNNIYVLDIVRDKLNLREREEKLFELHAKYQPKYVLYEKYGMMVDADAMREAMNNRNYRFTITEVAGQLKKEDRIRRLIPYFHDGRIWLPEELLRADNEGVLVDLIEEFIQQEYLTFPVGAHDDLIDALSRLFDAPTLAWPNNNFDYYSFYKGM